MADKSGYDRKKAIKDDQLLTNYADLLNQKLGEQVQNYREINKLRKGLLNSMVDEKDNLQQQYQLIEDYEEQLSKIADRRTKAYKDLKREVDLLKEAVKQEERRKDLADDLTEKATGFLDDLETQVKNIPIIGDLLAHAIDFGGLKEQMGGIMQGITKQFVSLTAAGVPAGQAIGMSFKSAIPSVMSFGASLWAALAPILPIIIAVVAAIALFKKALEIDQAVADLSREMGIANDEAGDMISNFNGMSAASGNLNATTKNLIQAQKELASSIGMTAQYSSEMLQDQISLTKYMGMSGDQAANFQKIAAGAGMSTREMQREVAGTVQSLNDAAGTSVDFAGVMRDIADLTGEMKARFRGNVKEMALAVAQAKALGTTLQESSDAAQNLLNMESSLQAEMKARVLTGVNINNDEIRRAQLMGDQAEVLRLQAKQLNEIGDISNKLPHEQKAIADAMGMTVDQLVEMNEAQTMLRKLGVENLADLKKEDILRSNLTKEEKEKLLRQREQMSVQEKMNAMTEKLSALWDQIASILVPIIGWLVDVMLPSIQTAVKQVQGIFDIFKGLVKLFTGDFEEGLALIGQGIKDFILAPFIGIWDTVKAIFGFGGDSSSPDAGETSVEDAVISPDGGVISTSPEDFLIATKNPAGLANSVAGSAGAAGIDYDKLAAALAAHPLQVVIDGKVINAITRKQSMNKSYNKMMG